jgi:hypothetical protein
MKTIRFVLFLFAIALCGSQTDAQWVQTNGPYGGEVYSLVVSGPNLFAATYGGSVFYSTDNGTSWTEVSAGLPNATVGALAVSGTYLFAGTSGRGIFRSTNNGTSWTEVNSGLTDTVVHALAVSGTDLFAGTAGGGVWRRPLSEMITTVEPHSAIMPAHFHLGQNYPNPFNPSTTILYGLPSRSHVTLTVFNTLGQQVATLVAGEQEAGFHEVQFEASGLASGVYLYRLQAGDFVQTKRLLLLR